jgi:hypothetical protein
LPGVYVAHLYTTRDGDSRVSLDEARGNDRRVSLLGKRAAGARLIQNITRNLHLGEVVARSKDFNRP